MNVLVTGAGGFLGGSFCSYLRRQDPSIVIYALVRNELAAARLNQQGVIALMGDLTEGTTYRKQLQTCSVVFHLGGDASFTEGDYERNNIQGTKTLLEECRGITELKRFVFASTIGVLDRARTDNCTSLLSSVSAPHPSSRYGKSKLIAEELVKNSKLPYTILRFTWIYGKGMRQDSHLAVLNEMVKRNSLLTNINFPGRVTTIAVEDCSRLLHSFCIGDWGLRKTLLVGDPTPISFGEIFSTLREVHKLPPPSMHLPKTFWSLLRMFRFALPFTLRCLVEDALAAEGEIKSQLPQFVFSEQKKHIKDTFLSPSDGRIIITGAASGIGYEFAKSLAIEATNLILVDKNPQITAVASTLGAQGVIMDLSASDCEKEFTALLAQTSVPIKGLILCAGIGHRGELHEHSLEQIEKIMNCNLTTTLKFSRIAYKDLRSTKGFLLLVASSIAETPLPGMAPYAASKAGVLSLGKSLWGEWQPKGIRVLTIAPTGTKTSFQCNAGVKVLNEGKGLLDPAIVAQKSLRALTRSSTPVLSWNGVFSLFMGVLGKLSPRLEIVIWRKLFAILR